MFNSKVLSIYREDYKDPVISLPVMAPLAQLTNSLIHTDLQLIIILKSQYSSYKLINPPTHYFGSEIIFSNI